MNVPSDSKMKLNVHVSIEGSTYGVEILKRVKEKTWSMKCPQIGVPISDFTRVKKNKTSKTLWNPTVAIDGHCVSDDLSALKILVGR